ncbi:centriolar coiled-coil protein of 110 kDa [Ascaphus truei]|uniref:centriolar coiled-coil protein of 110 kDa n=1 Tax=Ascaphus truei TaxID=8439 RepID=UPI003F59BE1E
MEEYEVFRKTHFARIQGEALHSESVSAAEQTISVIQFHGVAVLSPLLTVERKQEMQQYKQKAIELDVNRQNGKKKTLLNRVQEILETVQVKRVPNVSHLPSTENETTHQTADSKNMNGFAILPNAISLPMLSAPNGPAKIDKALKHTLLNTNKESKSYETNSVMEVNNLKQTKIPNTNHTKSMPSEIPPNQPTSDVDPSNKELDEPPPAKEAPDPYVMSIQNLLKKSREYIEKEQSRRNMKHSSKASTSESHSDKENYTIKISESVKEKARLLNGSRSSSPLMLDKPTLNKSNTLLQAASSHGQSLSSTSLPSFSKVDIPLSSGTPSDAESDEELRNSCMFAYEGSTVKSLTGSYAKLPSPEPSLSPKMHRRRPRPSSLGHIVINHPINAYDLSPKEKGKVNSIALPEKISLCEPVPILDGYTAGDCSVKGHSLNNNDIGCFPDLDETPKNSLVVSITNHDRVTNAAALTDGPLTALCRGPQLIENIGSTGSALEPSMLSRPADLPVTTTQNGNKPNGTGEMVKRNSPVELNKSYDVETPSPILMQCQGTKQAIDITNVSCVSEPFLENSFEIKVERRLNLDTDSARKEISAPPPTSEQEKRGLYDQRSCSGSLHTNKSEILSNSTVDDHLKKKMLAFEEMRKKLEEQHAHQLSLLIAEQEKEQEKLQKEFEAQDQRPRYKEADVVDLPEMFESGRMKPDGREISENSMFEMAQSHVETYRSSSHSTVGSVASTTQHGYGSTNESPFDHWGSAPSRMAKISAPKSLVRVRTQWSQVYSPAMQKKFNKVTALAKGFLTRRLMQTDKLKNLKQTVKDTAEFMRTFKTDVPLSRGAVSAQDASLHERVLAQLRAALYDIHDIFLELDSSERMNILLHDRELRHEKLIRQMEKMKGPRDRVTLSSATKKSLDRKKLTRGVEIGMSNKRLQLRPRTSETRILQPNQGQNGENAHINKLLCRQGSIDKKNPKKEAKCCDNLRRQHSLA